jgi:hypothetical protein
LSVNVFAQGLTPACCCYFILPHPVSETGEVEIADCDDNLLPANGYWGYFNPDNLNCNLMIPIAVSMGYFSPVLGAVAITFACSLAMSLPISTPPNAIAFATEIIETKDMARYGTIVSMIGIVVVFVVLYIAFGVLHIM